MVLPALRSSVLRSSSTIFHVAVTTPLAEDQRRAPHYESRWASSCFTEQRTEDQQYRFRSASQVAYWGSQVEIGDLEGKLSSFYKRQTQFLSPRSIPQQKFLNSISYFFLFLLSFEVFLREPKDRDTGRRGNCHNYEDRPML